MRTGAPPTAIFKGLDIDRYVQNHALAPVGGGGEARDPLRFDGFSECWFKDEQQFLRAVDTPTWARAVADGDNVFDMTQMLGAVLHERVVKAGDRELATA